MRQQQKIPLVQGYAVESDRGENNNASYQSQGAYVPNQGGAQQNNQAGGGNFNGSKGEQQPKKFQDAVWAVAFVAHLAVMAVVMVTMGSSYSAGGDNGYNYRGIVWSVSTCGLVAVGLSSLALGYMMKFADGFVKTALIFSVGCSLAIGILGAMTGQIMLCVVGFLSFAIGICYTYAVWSRIPFAASNLRTGLAAVKGNMGMVVIAYLFLVLALGWTIWWSVTAGAALRSVGQATLFFFLLSYYWVHQVFQNTVHVTTAGVIGTWWFVPLEASGFWSSAIQDSLVRATTFSFGSICFGSFLVALVQTLRAMNRIARENENGGIVVCIIDCILGCVESIVEYLNKWAYVYVGLYGYSYLEAGSNAITLFQNKGWSTIITDDLANNVLFMVSIAIGLITGLVGLIIGKADENAFEGIGVEDSGLAGFILGFLVGNLFSTIMMSVVASAINTVIVLFAEAPAEFQTNHPELSNDMRAAWSQAWPSECGNL